MKTVILYAALCIVLSACQAAPVLPSTPTPFTLQTPTLENTIMPATVQPTAEARLSEAALNNAAYHSPDWGDYQLKDGFFYRTPQTADESPQLYSTELTMPIFGDLNADGFADAVVVLKTQNGGNGNDKELAAVLDEDGKAVNVSTVPLGFMVGVESIQIESGIIVVNMRVPGPNDPLCCPSQLETRQFRLENNQLVRLP